MNFGPGIFLLTNLTNLTNKLRHAPYIYGMNSTKIKIYASIINKIWFLDSKLVNCNFSEINLKK